MAFRIFTVARYLHSVAYVCLVSLKTYHNQENLNLFQFNYFVFTEPSTYQDSVLPFEHDSQSVHGFWHHYQMFGSFLSILTIFDLICFILCIKQGIFNVSVYYSNHIY